MLIKIISGILGAVALFMGLKQGWAMASGKPEMLEMFGKWGFGKQALAVNGIITIVSALLLLHPKTFFWGNFLMAAGIFLIICFHVQDHDMKGVAIELPFLLINLVLISLRHPFAKP